MTRRNVLLVLCAAAVLLVAGGLFASNMGFKINRSMSGPTGAGGTTLSGTHMLGLPYNRQLNIDDADQLIDDMNATGTPLNGAANVQKFDFATDQLAVYTGTTPGQTPFALAACECYKTQVNAANLAYIAVGSHDPSLLCPLKGTSGSLSGTNYFTQPYHSTFDKADELLSDLNTNGSPVNCALNV
jgi:hypothetical protein